MLVCPALWLQECLKPSKFRGKSVSLCMTARRWDAVLDFYKTTGAAMVLGTQYFTDAQGVWEPGNVEALLSHTAAAGLQVRGLELGEEMSPRGHALDALVAAYASLKKIAARIFPARPPVILGPSTGMGQENEGNSFMNTFLERTLAQGAGYVDVVNMHSYNNDGGWPQPGFLRQTRIQAAAMLDMTRRHDAGGFGTRLWCGECGPHNGGGIRNVTDRATSSFWYIDALGRLARMGLQQHGRQALEGSHYGLLQLGTHRPNPDYWALLGWKRLMGTKVLSVEAVSGGGASINDTLHVYAHCSRRTGDGNVSFAFVNIGRSASFELDLVGLGAPANVRSEFHFRPAGGNLLGQDLELNGVLLALDGDCVPHYVPLRITDPRSSVHVSPLSFGFIEVAHAAPSLCN